MADLHPFRFLSLRQHEAKEIIILRAPRGTLFTAIRCTGDEGDSFGRIYVIFEMFERTYLLVRWFTAVFTPPVSEFRDFLSETFTKYYLTSVYVVIECDLVVGLVHPIQDSCHPDYYYFNTCLLGTTLATRPHPEE